MKLVYSLKKLVKEDLPRELYHRHHKKVASKILANLERERGKLSSILRKSCNDYAFTFFGSQKYAPWLYVYAIMKGTFQEGWIPDNFYGLYVVPQLKGDYGSALELKGLQGKLLEEGNFPNIGYKVNHLYFDSNYRLISLNNFRNLLFAKNERIVFKLDNTIQGKGVQFLSKDKCDLSFLANAGNGVFQSYIQQHEFFDEIMPGSVATLRITSVTNDDGEPQIRACYLRIGRSSDTHVRSASHIRVPVSLVSGELDSIGYLSDWTSTDHHPDSKVKFGGMTIPNFDECLDLILKYHSSLPFVRTIGWDTVVDKNGKVNLMECNGFHNDIKFSESTQGPCFRGLGWEELRGK